MVDMIGFASITPGPIGLNIATFAGMKTAGLLGASIATLSEVLPSFIIIILISKLLVKYKNNYYVTVILETLKPISCALLFSVFIKLLIPHLNDLKSMLLLLFFIIISVKIKKNPLIYFVIACIVGIVLNAF